MDFFCKSVTRDGDSSMMLRASMAALASMGGSEAEKQYLRFRENWRGFKPKRQKKRA